MIYKLAALICMAIFYGAYFGKMFLQKRNGIVTNQMARNKNDGKLYFTELLLKIVTYIIPVGEIVSILIVKSNLVQEIFGLYFALLGDAVFLLAIIAMKDSWRAGIAKDDDNRRKLVTNGIYRYSRNPAFLGFDLVYIGILVMFFNYILLLLTVFAIVMMHLQIINEEAYLEKIYGESYLSYKKETGRYAGLGKITFLKLLLYCYVLLFIWSVLYFPTCAVYGGPSLSWLWLWPALIIFSAIRIMMILKEIEGCSRIPKVVFIIYRIIFVIGLAFFVYFEGQIINSMTAVPEKDLDYVIVLGAGLRGSVPTNPLRVRIEEAYEYMIANEDTILIASGGQGPDEDMSEAQCIRDKLVESGIDPARIILEDKSTSTEENLEFSYEIIGDSSASVGIITNGFHEYRAQLIAKNVGFENVHSVPAITLFPVGIHYTIREFFGVIQYSLCEM